MSLVQLGTVKQSSILFYFLSFFGNAVDSKEHSKSQNHTKYFTCIVKQSNYTLILNCILGVKELKFTNLHCLFL